MPKSIYTLPSKKDSVLITKEEILQILELYRIGKKPLSLLLGWGETTIIRYLSGITPTIEYSRELRRIAEDPVYYCRLLELNREKLTEIAFQKSHAALQAQMFGNKLHLIAQYIINRANGDISAKRVQTVLYYCQNFSLVLRNHPLFDDDCQILADFMPYPSVYRFMRENKSHYIDFDPYKIPAEDTSFIDCIYNALDWYGPEAFLIVYKSEYNDLKKLCSRNRKSQSLTKACLCEYFSSVFSAFHIKKPTDINIYIKKRIAGPLKDYSQLKHSEKKELSNK